MIRYALRCARGHAFESWFASSAAYDSQRKRKLVECPNCGSASVEKSIMAPQIAKSGKSGKDSDRSDPPADLPASEAKPVALPAVADASPPLMMAPDLALRAKLRELRDHIAKNADDVGKRFPDEARKMHYGEIAHRPIYGEATPDEARALIDEGLEVSPIPILPDDRN